MKNKKILSRFLLVVLLAGTIQVFYSCNKKDVSASFIKNKTQKTDCCKGILYNAKVNITGMQLRIFYNEGGDQTYASTNALTFIEENGEELLIAEYELYPSKFSASYIALYDTLKLERAISDFKTIVFKQSLFELPCGTVFENERKCCSEIIVYLNRNGRETCYVCAVSEITNHQEFQYFKNILDDTTYFVVPLSAIKSFDEDMLNRKEHIQDIMNKIRSH